MSGFAIYEQHGTSVCQSRLNFGNLDREFVSSVKSVDEKFESGLAKFAFRSFGGDGNL